MNCDAIDLHSYCVPRFIMTDLHLSLPLYLFPSLSLSLSIPLYLFPSLSLLLLLSRSPFPIIQLAIYQRCEYATRFYSISHIPSHSHIILFVSTSLAFSKRINDNILIEYHKYKCKCIHPVTPCTVFKNPFRCESGAIVFR